MKSRHINRAKRWGNSCRNNNSCPYCRGSRLYQANREIERTEQELKDVQTEGQEDGSVFDQTTRLE